MKHTLEKHIASLNKLFCYVSRAENNCMPDNNWDKGTIYYSSFISIFTCILKLLAQLLLSMFSVKYFRSQNIQPESFLIIKNSENTNNRPNNSTSHINNNTATTNPIYKKPTCVSAAPSQSTQSLHAWHKFRQNYWLALQVALQSFTSQEITIKKSNE